MLRRWAAAAACRTRARLIAAGKLEEDEEDDDAGNARRKSRGEDFRELQEFLRIIDARDEPFDVDSYQHVLQLCTRLRAMAEGARVHDHIRRSRMEAERFVGNDLVFMYAAFGNPGEARRIFDGLGSHNVLSFTAIMRAYVTAGDPDEALKILHLARLKAFKADPSMLAMAVEAAGMKRDLSLGRFFHDTIRRCGYDLDAGVAISLIGMYSNCGEIEAAVQAFDRVKRFHRVLVWNACLEAFARNGDLSRALGMFRVMILEGMPLNPSSFRIALGICRSAEDLSIGRLIHSCASSSSCDLRRDLAVELVRMYGIRCGSLDEAVEIFQRIHKKDLQAWNAMIRAYLTHGHRIKALEGFTRMCLSKIVPDRESFLLALDSSPGLKDCKMIHALLVRNRVEISDAIREKLVAAYGSSRPGRDGQRAMAKIHERILGWDREKREEESYVFSFFDFQD
ncbi:putative pentatricopeptide repeat-containing protein At5g52630 [Selaginella moellendorffii]|uniref:putative pentatricopeptide repeat-containing protein At5g52630 n=1 Tax=Selaginella moellendorffii TaxID=88036 RepID=UPI000D1C5E9B|nr:putative pentatricopeptide repeat-containing protein At5g52630 [Selaginella moellendorffii]|eukprot:XP_024523330.1 putative pentatricopeptide repeat-containing protein At5g52630 [Selaginella moellendorffii]